MKLKFSTINACVELALAEDLGSMEISTDKDLTTSWVVPEETQVTAMIISKEPGVIAGLPVARAVFQRLDTNTTFEASVAEGDQVDKGTTIAHIVGSACVVLTGERIAINFLQHLSGIATFTCSFVQAVKATGVQITDTRKTIPGLRALEKYAVRVGGVMNSHRSGLYDMILIKENHVVSVGNISEAIRRVHHARQKTGYSHLKIAVEVRNLDEVRETAVMAPDRIILDNMISNLVLMRESVNLIRQISSNIEIEATGGITLDNVVLAANTGVDIISIGALTHSAPSLDISLLFTTREDD